MEWEELTPELLGRLRGGEAAPALAVWGGDVALANELVGLAQERDDVAIVALELGGRDVIEMFRVFLAEGKHLANLRELKFSQTAIRESHARVLAEALKHGNHVVTLEKLNLAYNPVGDAGAFALADALKHGKHLGTLKELDLMISSIGSSGAAQWADVLKHCKHLGSLKILELGWNSIGTSGVVALADALRYGKHLCNVEWLGLERNCVGDAGAVALADALRYGEHLGNLKVLILAKNSIDDPGAAALAEALKHGEHLRNVDTLNLRDNSYADSGSSALASAMWPFTNMTFSGVKAPVSLLPKSATRSQLLTALEMLRPFLPLDTFKDAIAPKCTFEYPDFRTSEPVYEPTLHRLSFAQRRLLLAYRCFPSHHDRVIIL